MISFLKGIVQEVTDNHVILELSGIGFTLNVTKRTKDSVKIGDFCCFNVILLAKNENISLYGFLDKLELDIFSIMTKVSGIGPKTALNVVSELSLPQIYQAAKDKNSAVFLKVGGIGKKTAERLTIELGYRLEKVSWDSKLRANSLTNADQSFSANLQMEEDLKSALRNLGFSRNQILDAWAGGFSTNDDLATNLTRFLKILSNNR